MIRLLFKFLILVILMAVVGTFLLGWWPGGGWLSRANAERSISRIDTSKAREVGAEIGSKATEAATVAQAALADGSITAKIKAKMTLDDSVRARSIDVSTSGSTVTLSGTVRSAAEHDRTVRLARETEGVTRVVDHLVQAS